MVDILEDRPSSKKVGVLRALVPYFAPYKFLVILALLALVITATVSLTLPVAARKVIDGFSAGNYTLLNQYFLAAVGIAAIFALGTGLRYYIVTPCIREGKDQYNRSLAECFVNNQSLSSFLVRSGYAFAFRRYSKKFIEDENYAKSKKLGMWSMEFDYPWDWRKKN